MAGVWHETLEEKKERVKAAADLRLYCESELKPKGRTFVCPCCSSGEKENGTPAFSLYRHAGDGELKWHCLSCGNGGDVLDLYGFVHHVQEYKEKLRGVAAWAHVDIGDDSPPPVRDTARPVPKKAPPDPERERRAAERIASNRQKYERRLKECADEIDDPRAARCLESHGLTVEAARRHNLGFSARCKFGQRVFPALMIPYPGAPWYYTARALDDRAPHKYARPRSEDVGPTPIWNVDALKGTEVVLVEGQFDAIAVEEAGFPAIALGSTGSRRLLEEMKSREFTGVAVVMLDHDKAGARGRHELVKSLRKMADEGYPVYAQPFSWPEAAPKDAAEWLAADRDALSGSLGSAFRVAWRRAATHLGLDHDEIEAEHEREPAPEPEPDGLGVAGDCAATDVPETEPDRNENRDL